MRTYTTSTQSFAKIRRDLIIQLGLIYGLISSGIVGWEVWKNRSSGEGNLYSLVLIVVIMILAGIFGIRKAIAQQQEIWNSIQITFGSDNISRQQIRFSEVKIYRSDITGIEEHKAGLIVKTAEQGRIIFIPAQLDRADYLKIKETLVSWQGEAAIVAKKNTKDMVMAISYLVAFVALFLSFNIWLNFVIGTGIIIAIPIAMRYTKLLQNNC